MSARINAECPYCHHHGTLSQEVERGRKIRCTSCRQVFAYESQPGPGGTDLPLGDSGVKAEAWDEAVREAKLADAPEASELAKHGRTISEGESANDLEKRLQLLERANRRLKVGLGLAALLAIASFFFPTTNPGRVLSSGSEVVASRITTPRIVTRELVLVDSDGHPVGGINSLLNFAQLELKGSEDRCELSPSSIFFWGNEKPRAVLSTGHGKDSQAGMTLHDDTGKIRLEFSATRHTTRLMLSDHMRPIIEMRSSASGPSLEYLASPRGLYEPIIPKPSQD